MAIVNNDNISTLSPKAIDNRQGRFVSGVWRPYNDVAEANSIINSAYRFKGLTVNILVGGLTTEYWYKDGITNSDLVQKNGASGGLYEGTL